MKIVSTNHVQTPLTTAADSIDITVSSFELFPTTVNVKWVLYSSTTGINVQEGVMTIPEVIVSTWGTDDTVIKDYVLTELNLTEDNS